jgi:hypothetical protein
MQTGSSEVLIGWKLEKSLTSLYRPNGGSVATDSVLNTYNIFLSCKIRLLRIPSGKTELNGSYPGHPSSPKLLNLCDLTCSITLYVYLFAESEERTLHIYICLAVLNSCLLYCKVGEENKYTYFILKIFNSVRKDSF